VTEALFDYVFTASSASSGMPRKGQRLRILSPNPPKGARMLIVQFEDGTETVVNRDHFVRAKECQ
jgi:hypothetical protein